MMANIIMYVVAALAAGLVTGAVVSAAFQKKSSESKIKDIENKSSKALEDALKEAGTIKKEAQLEAKDIILKVKSDSEKEERERRLELNQLDKRLHQREETLDRKLDQMDKKEIRFNQRETDLSNKEKTIQKKHEDLEKMTSQQTEVLERIANMSADEAKKELFQKVEEESKFEISKLTKKLEDEALEASDRKSKKIICTAIQRYSSDYVSENTVSTVALPSDEMKGRVIGREGRNIRALEAATGVEFIIDDTPETVLLSCFDPVRREIGRISLTRLLADGRIHPARIEEIVSKVEKEIATTIKEEGEKAVFDLGLHGIHPELIKLIGRLKYRTSYGQNVLQHSKEVAHFASIMAAELKGNVKLAKRAGILHDIGKAIDHEIEGSHQVIGADFAKKYGENEKVVNAILVHHEEGDPITIEATLVAAGDALSAARPGARKESLEGYIKRLERLEEIATSFEGVSKSYAIQAGREVRILVKPEDISDERSAQISRELAKKIEEELTYPGQIKVTVIRESRFVEYAK
ncbi:MAG: ribonuclease Y [Thermodesulfovibrionia bacterium]|nr:ribonuclease Y [Thermodesulfovibrionia bacterium]